MSAPIKNEWDDIILVEEDYKVLHLVPVDDWVGHETVADCVCGPYIERLGASDFFVVHYALDGRE